MDNLEKQFSLDLESGTEEQVEKIPLDELKKQYFSHVKVMFPSMSGMTEDEERAHIEKVLSEESEVERKRRLQEQDSDKDEYWK